MSTDRPVRRDRPSSVAFSYSLVERVSVEAPAAHRHVERWDVSVRIDDPENDQQGRLIGDASVIILNVDAAQDVRDLADPVRGEWRDVAAIAARGSDELETPVPAGHMLVLDRVWVEPDYRGNGLGPIIATRVIERLRRGCHLAACYPAPFEGACRPEDRRREVEGLSRIWAEVGFRHWRDGVWMLRLDEGR